LAVLILLRLWLSRAHSPFTASRTTSSTISFTPIIIYLAESGAIYTSVVVIVFATFWVKSAATIIFVNSVREFLSRQDEFNADVPTKLASLIVVLFCAVLMQIYRQREAQSKGRYPTVSTLRVAPNPNSRNRSGTMDMEVSISQFELQSGSNGHESEPKAKFSHTASSATDVDHSMV
jgi:hypothetical protein